MPKPDIITSTSAPIENLAENPAKTNYSKMTLAKAVVAKTAMEELQKSVIADVVKIPGNDPQAVMDIILKTKDIQTKIDELSSHIAEHTSSDFTDRDVASMREMKGSNMPETTIAEYFGTNQTKVNRLLNGKS